MPRPEPSYAPRLLAARLRSECPYLSSRPGLAELLAAAERDARLRPSWRPRRAEDWMRIAQVLLREEEALRTDGTDLAWQEFLIAAGIVFAACPSRCADRPDALETIERLGKLLENPGLASLPEDDDANDASLDDILCGLLWTPDGLTEAPDPVAVRSYRRQRSADAAARARLMASTVPATLQLIAAVSARAVAARGGATSYRGTPTWPPPWRPVLATLTRAVLTAAPPASAAMPAREGTAVPVTLAA